MKKFIFFSVIVLLIFATVGCGDKDKIKEDCECEYTAPNRLEDKYIDNESGTIKKLSSPYSEELLFAIVLDDPREVPLFPCNLPKEYKKEGIKVKVTGIRKDCSAQSKPNIKIAPFFKLNITSIKLNTK